jgi:hypothetical protein
LQECLFADLVLNLCESLDGLHPDGLLETVDSVNSGLLDGRDLLLREWMLAAGVVGECGLRLVLEGDRLQQRVQLRVDLALRLAAARLQLDHLNQLREPRLGHVLLQGLDEC